jgi:hypothetical protein
MKTVLFGTFVLVGIYLAVSHATGGGQLLNAGFNGYAKSVKVLQGRG